MPSPKTDRNRALVGFGFVGQGDEKLDSGRAVPTARPSASVNMPIFSKTLALNHSAQAVYDFHSRPGAFARLTPPWQAVKVLQQSGEFANRRVVMDLAMGLGSVRWVAQHRDAIPARQFVDEQVQGPFAQWRHSHLFIAEPADVPGCQLTDSIEWQLPGGGLGRWLAGGHVEALLKRTFAFRHRRTRVDLDRHAAFAAQKRLRVAISGASGLVGTALTAYLETAGHTVQRLVRRVGAGPEEIQWNPDAGTVDLTALEGVDAIVHLAGENVGARWTAARREAVLRSRVQGTATLANAICRLPRRPSVFVSASAVGLYGDTGDAEVDETSPKGTGFLAEVCRAWEQAAEPARTAGVRVVHPRIGVVLTAGGGALAKLLPPFRLGAGGPIGAGTQGFPWVALDDVLAALELALHDDRLDGPVNLVAPQLLTQRAFAATLGAVLRRPALLPMPAPVIRALFGDMGREVLLAGQRVGPRRLQELGFRFEFEQLADLLSFELGRPGPVRAALGDGMAGRS